MIVWPLWLLLAAPASSSARAQPNPATTFKTTRSLSALEKCLYEELSDLGDATFMRSPGETILMIRNGQARPMIVDITPPTLAITTRTSAEIRERVKRCV